MRDYYDFRYSSSYDETNDNINISFSANSEDVTIFMLAKRFKMFALALGYSPTLVDRVIKLEDDE